MVAPPPLAIPVKDQNPLPTGSDDPQDIWEALSQLRSDLMTLLYQAQAEANQTIHLSGAASVAAPVAGKADCWISLRIPLPASGGGNFYTIKVARQGQLEQSQSQTNQNLFSVDAYKEYFMGTFTVGAGDVLGVSLVATGAPVVALTLADITIRCELAPRNNANA